MVAIKKLSNCVGGIAIPPPLSQNPLFILRLVVGRASLPDNIIFLNANLVLRAFQAKKNKKKELF